MRVFDMNRYSPRRPKPRDAAGRGSRAKILFTQDPFCAMALRLGPTRSWRLFRSVDMFVSLV